MRVALTIAGSDSGGGAGLQADLKTFHQFGVFGTSVVTAVTAQNTRRVAMVHPVPVSVVEAQLAALAEDLPPHATKSGMLGTAELARAVARGIATHGLANYVLDPVMVATSGERLLDRDGERAVADMLVPLCTVVTPNLEEAAALTGAAVRTPDDMEQAGRSLVSMGAGAALVKGGHLSGSDLVDVLVTPAETRRFAHPRLATSSTHGTGCALSAAIAAGLAHGRDLARAVEDAVDFVQRALAEPPGLGGGRGPLDLLVRPASPAPGRGGEPR